jgi:hypothetical protein
MRRHQIFGPEDLERMGNVYRRASRELPQARDCEKQRTQLAKAIIITYRPKATEAALATTASHLVGLRYLN